MQSTTQPSGISELLKAPLLLDFEEYRKSIEGVFCYIIRHYGHSGLSLLYGYSGDTVSITCGDWDGNALDIYGSGVLETSARVLVENHSAKIFEIMNAIGLKRAQLFFTQDLVLTDVQVSPNKLCGPGMLKEIFGKSFEIQEVLAIEVMDQQKMDAAYRGTGSFSGDVILKPSSFKITQTASGTYTPLYVQVTR